MCNRDMIAAVLKPANLGHQLHTVSLLSTQAAFKRVSPAAKPGTQMSFVNLPSSHQVVVGDDLPVAAQHIVTGANVLKGVRGQPRQQPPAALAQPCFERRLGRLMRDEEKRTPGLHRQRYKAVVRRPECSIQTPFSYLQFYASSPWRSFTNTRFPCAERGEAASLLSA